MGYPAAQETGAAQQNHNSFYVVTPKEPRAGAPLCVVLHSANRTAYDYLGFGVLNRKIENGDDPATVMTGCPTISTFSTSTPPTPSGGVGAKPTRTARNTSWPATGRTACPRHH